MKATLPVYRLEAARVVVSIIGRCLCLTKPASHVVAEQKDKKRYKDPKEPNEGRLRTPRRVTLSRFDSGSWLVTWATRIRHVAVYKAAHDIARDGNLPLRWEGSYHIWAPEQIDTAVASLMRLREKYAHGPLQFNSIKIHCDGMQDILTAGMLEPYASDSDNYGGVLFTPQRLIAFMQELDGYDIDLHMHSSGDRATRNILDAVEQAREA